MTTTGSPKKSLLNFHSLRTRLACMAMAVALIPMLLAAGYTFYSQTRQINASLSRELSSTLNTCTLSFQTLRDRLELTTRATANDNTCKTTLRLGVLYQLQGQLEILAREYRMDLLVATDTSGQIMAMYPPLAAGSGNDLSQHPFIGQALRGEALTATVEEKHPSLIQAAGGTMTDGQPGPPVLLESSVPIMIRDTPIGAILAGIRLSGNSPLMLAMQQASGAHHTFLTLPDRIVATSAQKDVPPLQGRNPLFDALNRAKTAGESQSLTSVICPLDNRRKVFKAAELAGLPGKPAVSLVAFLDYDPTGMLIRDALLQILMVFAASVLVAAAITFFVARHIAAPINALSLVMRDMDAGMLPETPLPVTGKDEIGLLIQGYNTMITKIQAHTHGLEREVQERLKAEKALRYEKEQLAVTLRSIGDAVITTDTEGNIVFINKVAEELTGWSNEEAQGQKISAILRLVDEKTGAPCISPADQVLATGKITTLAANTLLITRNGSQRHIADSGAPILDGDNRIIGFVIAFRDITETLKMEQELLKIKQLESIGILAGGIAHDFNNILAGILGNIEVAAYRIAGKDEKTSSLLATAQKAVMRATGLTGQLLTFAKGGSPVKDTTLLGGIIHDSAKFVLHGSHVVCRYHFPVDLWLAEVDSGQISQVIQNLVINAVNAMPEGGELFISGANITDPATEPLLAGRDGHFVKITIRDTGSGIAPEIIDRIFDPYFTTKELGNGLGLAICHSIVRKHHGYLTVQSKPGQGATFSIYLPASPVAAIATSATKQPPESPATPITSARVLVIDDEPILRELLKAQLAALGHETVLAADGAEGIRMYQELRAAGTPVDLVITDLTIPGGIGGKEAAQLLLQKDPRARLIVYSGYSNDPVMVNFRDYGFRAALTKPFNIEELEKAMKEAFQS